MKLPGLADLLHPHDPDGFFDPDLPRDPFVTHDLDESIASIRALPFLDSLDSFLLNWRGEVKVHLPDVADESHSIDASPEDARKLFANGMALLFDHAERLAPVLREWLTGLHRDLGLPASTFGRCIVYATPDGKGTAPHFDQNINFVLQLHGTKRWWLAPNATFENPTERFTIGQPLDPELAAYAPEPAEIPSEMPSEGLREIILEPGSVLYVPRGYWHSTEAEGEALALNFTFSQPTWIDLLTLALRSRLTLSPEWRELADGVSSRDRARRESAQRRFDTLLADLVEDLPNWTARDILGATEGDFE